jgi:hypothetical protein
MEELMRTILSMMLSVSVFFTTMPEAQAVTGIIISNKTVKTIGGISTLVGAGSLAVGFLGTATLGNSVLFLGFSLIGATTGVIGLVILDEKSGELKFSPLTKEQIKILGIAQSEAEIYNMEVEELNLVKEDIESRITDKTSNEEVVEHWKEGQQYLSKETLVVASKIIEATVKIKQ